MTPELITTIIVAVLSLAVAILKIFKADARTAQATANLEKTEKVVEAIATAVNTVTPLLGVDKAKALKSEIKGTTSAGGVNDILDAVLSRHGLNTKPTAELANAPLE